MRCKVNKLSEKKRIENKSSGIYCKSEDGRIEVRFNGIFRLQNGTGNISYPEIKLLEPNPQLTRLNCAKDHILLDSRYYST